MIELFKFSLSSLEKVDDIHNSNFLILALQAIKIIKIFAAFTALGTLFYVLFIKYCIISSYNNLLDSFIQ